MEMSFLQFRCSHCDVKIFVHKPTDLTMVICNCGRWMAVDGKITFDAKSHGKHAGDFAIQKKEKELTPK